MNLVFEIHGDKIWDDTCILLFYSQVYNCVMVRVKKELKKWLELKKTLLPENERESALCCSMF